MRTTGWRSLEEDHVRGPAIKDLQGEPASRGSSVEGEADNEVRLEGSKETGHRRALHR